MRVCVHINSDRAPSGYTVAVANEYECVYCARQSAYIERG